MINQLNSLTLTPLRKYASEMPNKTSVTSFKKMLKKQTEKEAGEEINNDKTMILKKASTDKTQEKTNVVEENSSGVIFHNPETGAAYRYIDVAKEDTSESVQSTAQTSESASAVKKNDTSSKSNTVKSKDSDTESSSVKKTKYDSFFKEAAKKYGVSESLLKGIAKAESNFNASDVSSAGATGVMQLMPATAKSLGVKNAYDPEQNILGGAKCISQKLKEFNGNVRLALAAYNAGSGAVKRNGGVPSYCTKYVERVLAYKKEFES